MGVHSLWGILEPTSRAVRLESLSRKRMAVDASIWIYQFLKAVRDKSGNSLTSSHIVGFFRRICKLLYFGIMPVFVFDGGAPVLKRETINKRKERRQGKRDDATKTAQKLLAIQLQKNQESPSKKQKQNVEEKIEENQDDIDYKYFEDFNKPNGGSINQEQEQPKFKGTDEYDLPKIKGFEYDKNDQRVSTEKFKDMSEHLDELEGIDLNTIDPASNEFQELPLTTQYMVLSQLRLRSRLRMGYSKEQLENIFPNSLDFSKFQIQMVQKRNFFTQRLMNITGMDDSDQKTQRIAGEKDKEYKIHKTEGGWALSLDNDSGTSYSNPVDLEKEDRKLMKRQENGGFGHIGDDDEDDDIDWEDVDVEAKQKEERVSHAMASLPLPPAETVLGEDSSGVRSFMAYTPQQKNKHSNITQEDLDNDDDGYNSGEEALRQIEEIELIEAIQRSKKELAKEKEMEHQLLGDDNSNVKSPDSLDKKSGKALEDDDEFDEDFEDVPFQVEENHVVEKPKSPQKETLFKGLPTFGKTSSVINKPKEVEPISRKTSTEKSIEKQNSDEQKSEEETKKKSIPSVPSWFNSTFDNPFKNLEKLKSQRDIQDKPDGIVSWSEAKNYIESKDKEDINNDNDDIVEVIPPPNLPSKVTESKDTNTTVEENDKVEEINDEIDDVEPINLDNSEATPAVVDYDFEEDEEEQLMEQLAKEEKEHEEFQKDLNPHILNNFFDNEKSLRDQQKRDLRDSDEVTVTMIKEVQELLARFGIPYITAPMEAEAQCAELLQLNLVDGIITDDSDVFLFGGGKVYKNMFHEKHYVEFYSSQDIERELGLTRQKLIEIAQLLGSDYTEGLKGIGPVNAMEILSHFGDLTNFRNWFVETQFDIGKQQNEESFLKNLRKKLIKNNILLDNTFPDKRIDQAYLQAEVDKDKTEFVWGTPDLDRIRTFLMSSVGWSQDKVDQVLVPLIKDLNKKKREGTQSTLGEFYPVDNSNRKTIKTLKLGKRMNDASEKMSSGKKRRTKK
ncbi:DNA repair protein [Wickerhamomyces ciferrii]|uniref:DNA repair protein n=1 Tax=Wickerhamomyces ciferrii (strain ATCC 14091 / BCRC 22168 / CBS 111 / JCM 3599 / NBRC 0793 / NRRL Y-1031 F-60-10) TaxID=1206466 RepID=K0KM29_WICCF|nr:DNA repair protein [Wickerhamomyces ciferrii]CCH44056.1 DNA repair protein [Wickerhamomyces ciferrii]